MKLRSAGVDEIFDGLKYRDQIGALPHWRFRAARIIYLAGAALLRRLVSA